MKKTIFFCFLILMAASVTAQADNYHISGKVIDGVTKAPMQGASVFAQNTTMGTATTVDGNFSLRLASGGYDLVVTFTGYETTTRRISTADADDKNLVVEIRPKEKAMEDVVIKSSNEVKDGWEKYGSFFMDNFIGKTSNSKQCLLINKDVLKFYYYKKRNRLKVMASEPIEIENWALGYKIKYTLDSFVHEYGSQSWVYTGYPLFEEMVAGDSTQGETWRENRLDAYNGSILHFMRSIYQKSLKEEGFEVQFVAKNKDAETAIPLVNFYSALNYNMDDSTQLVGILPNQPDVAVLYTYEEPEPEYLVQNEGAPPEYQLSVINIRPGESIAIEKNGYYFDQNDIVVTGYWIWDKVGDSLPYDYIPELLDKETIQ